MSSLSKLSAQLEAILFIENSFVRLNDLCNKLQSNEVKIKATIDSLNNFYSTHKSSLYVLEKEESYLLTINKDISTILSQLYRHKTQQKISRNLIETLSVIAYSQPVTKSKIDELRGVNSDNALRLLLGQKLIRKLGKMPVPGNPLQYGTTPEFLKCFGLTSIKDLPKLSAEELAKFDSKNNETHRNI